MRPIIIDRAVNTLSCNIFCRLLFVVDSSNHHCPSFCNSQAADYCSCRRGSSVKNESKVFVDELKAMEPLFVLIMLINQLF